ncbi:MAG: GNAT family N-acetyltransferase, partial [Actinomycetota bacterium]|nr:GNAT family N-acetyltransferase [Actinomycetota bacterium]
MNIRQLAAHDAPVYQPLRLRALREHPEAFGSSPEDEQPLPLEQVARRLEDTSGNSVSFGAWLDGQLVGIVSLYRSPRPKTRHKALLG